MAHRSRLGGLVIDCRADDLAEAMAFWGEVFGRPFRLSPDDPRYAELEGEAWPQVLLQAVDHEPRVHLDFETDDREAERARLEGLGARPVGSLKGWHVMEAPTGHRFCVVREQGTTGGPAPVVWEAH